MHEVLIYDDIYFDVICDQDRVGVNAPLKPWTFIYDLYINAVLNIRYNNCKQCQRQLSFTTE